MFYRYHKVTCQSFLRFAFAPKVYDFFVLLMGFNLLESISVDFAKKKKNANCWKQTLKYTQVSRENNNLCHEKLIEAKKKM